MPTRFSKEEWRNILELASMAVKYSAAERRAFLERAGSNSGLIEQVLLLTEAYEAPPAVVDRVSSTIGHFTITQRIGRGGMGEVYLARDVELQRQVAIKFLSPSLQGMEGAGERFLNEARTASALNHPNIVTIHEVIRLPDGVAIVMELVDGSPLRELCSTPVGIDRQLRLGRQIAAALAEAHSAGIVHRDIKPANVMVTADDRVKVLDFGLARQSRPEDSAGSSLSGTFAGTWRYMSPEQIGSQEVSSASDIFSLGLVLYELATGRHPFEAPSPFETMQAILDRNAEPPSRWNAQISRQHEELILAMLSKDATARPSAREIVLALSAIETGSEPLLVSRPLRIRNAIWATCIAAVVVAVGAWWLTRPASPRLQIAQVTSLVAENRATAAAISPDGAYTAYANVDGVQIRSSQTGETTILRGPKQFVVDQLAWFSKGGRLVASGFSASTNQRSIWSISITGDEPLLVRNDARHGVPSPDGLHIVYLSGDSSSIWVVGATGAEARQILKAPEDDTFTLAFWSADSKRLGFQRRHYAGPAGNISAKGSAQFRRSLELYDLEQNAVAGVVEDLWVDSSSTMPDGRILLLCSDEKSEEAFTNIWELRSDSAIGWKSGSLRHVTGPLEQKRDSIGAMSATADGKKILFLRQTSQNAISVGDFKNSPPRLSDIRRLTFDEKSNYPHAWTADSTAVIFESDRNGTWDVFQQRMDQRVAETIVATPKRWDVLPQMAPDGKTVLYAMSSPGQNPGPYSLMRVSLRGGAPEPLPMDGALDEFRCTAGGCVLRSTQEQKSYVFYELDASRGKGRELARTQWMPGIVGDWGLSWDGKQLAIPNHDSRSAKIRVLDLRGQRPETTIDIAGLSDLGVVAWAADGSGWFVSVQTSVGSRMTFVGKDGKVTPLGDIQGWAAPSPDGRKVAFLNRVTSANAWLITFE